MFRDRREAGRRLAEVLAAVLESRRAGSPLLLAIPMGGVQVAYEVAVHLGAPGTELSILVARKLPFPENPEAGFGAVAEDGSTVLLREFANRIPESLIQRIVAEQRQEITRRIRVLRGGAPLPEMESRTVILIDDGIAMGSTMQAAIRLCKKRKPGALLVAVPVASRDTKRRLSWIVDQAVVLETPRDFRAVADAYEHWYDVPDHEATELFERWRRQRESQPPFR